jgi:hypothetical protein
VIKLQRDRLEKVKSCWVKDCSNAQ